MRVVFLVALAVSLAMTSGVSAYAAADTIDFESLAEGGTAGTIKTETNAVTFKVGSTAPTLPAYVAGVGLPQTAWNPNDTPNPATHAGSRFLTDEPRGPSVGYDYFMAFENPVTSLSLDLYDFRPDGGPRIGDNVILNLYADEGYTMVVGQTRYTITGNEVDENVVPLSVRLNCATARTARLVFSHTDIGTGIDNITFETSGKSDTVAGDVRPDHGVDLVGIVKLDGAPPAPGLLIWISEMRRGVAYRPEIAPDGFFAVPSISPGHYVVEITPETGSVAGVRQGGRNVGEIVVDGAGPPGFVEIEIAARRR
ncbi:MAG TPA: hypothetical protein VFY29_17855 [Terriglobia bacterium]|nr:hypothetical protein [Terriglobia bacterium]